MFLKIKYDHSNNLQKNKILINYNETLHKLWPVERVKVSKIDLNISKE